MPFDLDAQVVRNWARLAAGALGRDRGVLDAANVFPVPDADTGSNLYLTARAGARAVAELPPNANAAQLLAALARGALVGARGNSGTILAEWYRGLAGAAAHGDDLSTALGSAATAARQAVAKPVPGTILTGADAAAKASAAVPGQDPGARIAAAVKGAREAAVESPSKLPQLAKAGTLDAGACGLVLVLDALRAAVQQSDPADADGAAAPVALGLDLVRRPLDDSVGVAGDFADHGGLDDDEFEVMFTLWRPAGAPGLMPGEVAGQLRADLAGVGGSVVVVGGAEDAALGPTDTVWHAHVHVADLDAVRALLLRWADRGRIDQIQVRYLAVPDSDLTVFATASTPQLADEFARGGAVVLANERIGAQAQGDTETALSPEDLARAALGSATPAVLVLAPGDAAFAAQVQRRVDELITATRASGALDATETLPIVRAIATPSDLATAVALGALAETDSQDPTDRERAVAELLERTTMLHEDSAADLATFPPAAPSGSVVTALVDSDVPRSARTELTSRYGDQLVFLESNNPGPGVDLAISPDDT